MKNKATRLSLYENLLRFCPLATSFVTTTFWVWWERNWLVARQPDTKYINARQIFSYLVEIHVSQNLARKTLWNSIKGPLEAVKGKQAQKYRQIPKISPGDYIFQRPFLRGLFLEWFIYGGKFAFQNRLD